MTPLTLKAFFADDDTQPIFDSCEPGAAEAAIRGAIKRAEKDAWPGLEKTCGELADRFFDVRLEKVLADGWGRLVDFAECLKRSRAAPQEVCRCHLLEHEIDADYEPRIEVVSDGVKVVARIPLRIGLSATIEGLELELRAGEIVAVCAGEISAEASFSIKGKTLIKRSSGPFPLPGRLDFRAGAAAPVAAEGEKVAA